MSKMLVLLTAIILMSGCINYSVDVKVTDNSIVDTPVVNLITSEEMLKMLPTLSSMPDGTVIQHEYLYENLAVRQFRYDDEKYYFVKCYMILRFETIEGMHKQYNELRSKYPESSFTENKNTFMVVTSEYGEK